VDFAKIDLMNAPDSIKRVICHLAACGFATRADGGFSVSAKGGLRTDAGFRRDVRKVFGFSASVSFTKAHRLIVKGDKGREFLELYKRAAGLKYRAEAGGRTINPDLVGVLVAGIRACADSLLAPINFQDITDEQYKRLGPIYDALHAITNEVVCGTPRKTSP
jgi:hypothetical protein